MLINCKECGKEVSDTAKKCPHCGAKVKKEKSKNNVNQKVKLGYIISVITSCVIAVCFFVTMILAAETPNVFFHSKAYDYLSNKHSKQTYAGYTFDTDFTRSEIGVHIHTDVKDSSNGVVFSVNHSFTCSVHNDEIFVSYDVSDKGNKIWYNIWYLRNNSGWYLSGTNSSQGYGGYKEYTVTDDDIRTAKAGIDLVETTFDVTLLPYSLDFDDVVKDFQKFAVSVKAIWTSSIALMSIFTVLAIAETVGYVLFRKIKNKKTTLNIQSEDESSN